MLRWSPFLIDFYLMLAFYGRKVFKLVAGDLPGPSWRHIQLICAGTSGNPKLCPIFCPRIIKLETDNVLARISELLNRIRSKRSDDVINVSLSFDATVVVPASLSFNAESVSRASTQASG